MGSTSATSLRPLRPPNLSTLITAPLPRTLWLVISASLAAHVVPGVSAYTWNFRSNPQQCQNVTIDLTGSGGQSPYRILIVPFGPSPLPNNIEARKIMEQTFATGNNTSGSIMLNYPANSQFVAVVSDAAGFGTGGTSVALQVGSSSDNSCFNSAQNVSPDFVFSILPLYQIVQCEPTRIWWDPNTVQGTPNFLGVIPGGQSFEVPRGQITQVQDAGTGFTWLPNLRGGTTLMLVGGDDRGNGTAGSLYTVVTSGINNNSTCLDQNSPSSTPGTPAGNPTSTSSAGAGGGGASTGAIVGGVIGGLAFIVSVFLALYFLKRRSSKHQRVKERPVDLLHEDDDEEEDDHHRNPNGQQHQLDYYTPEPFMVPDPTFSSDANTTNADLQSRSGYVASSSTRPLSGTSFSRSDTPDLLGGAGASANGYGWAVGSTTTGTSRKGGPMRMRPVNIVQHEDAGPPPEIGGDKEEETETVELPPAYTALQRAPRPPHAADGADSRPPEATPPAAGNETQQ